MNETHVSERADVLAQHVLEGRAPAHDVVEIGVSWCRRGQPQLDPRLQLVGSRHRYACALQRYEQLGMVLADDRLSAREQHMCVTQLWNTGALPVVECVE